MLSRQHTMKELLDTHWKDKTVRLYASEAARDLREVQQLYRLCSSVIPSTAWCIMRQYDHCF